MQITVDGNEGGGVRIGREIVLPITRQGLVEEALHCRDLSTNSPWLLMIAMNSASDIAIVPCFHSWTATPGSMAGSPLNMPEDAKEAIGHGVRAKRSKSGAIRFDLLGGQEDSHAAVQ
jgi:hypothetical protein